MDGGWTLWGEKRDRERGVCVPPPVPAASLERANALAALRAARDGARHCWPGCRCGGSRFSGTRSTHREGGGGRCTVHGAWGCTGSGDGRRRRRGGGGDARRRGERRQRAGGWIERQRGMAPPPGRSLTWEWGNGTGTSDPHGSCNAGIGMMVPAFWDDIGGAVEGGRGARRRVRGHTSRRGGRLGDVEGESQRRGKGGRTQCSLPCMADPAIVIAVVICVVELLSTQKKVLLRRWKGLGQRRCH